MTRNDITGDRIASKPAPGCGKCPRDTPYGPVICLACLDAGLSFPDDGSDEHVFGKSSQCGDCGGTRKVDGKPCRICCPTDDGPEKDEK
jgi:hypothetical protein